MKCMSGMTAQNACYPVRRFKHMNINPLPTHGRFGYSPITSRKDYAWPNGTRLAVYLGFNIEHFAFGQGLGARIGPSSPEPDVLNYSWREYGNRVGFWRCLELFDSLNLPTGAIINTAIFDHCPEVTSALLARGDEFIGHGHTNSVRQSDECRDAELKLITNCMSRIREKTGRPPAGWLSPWISESVDTPELLKEAGYRYTLNWCHDDQPTLMQTSKGPIWSIPYPQELNDIPMLVGRQMDSEAFFKMIIDNFEEMLLQANKQPLVMGIALHPYLVGQPYRVRHLRATLERIAKEKEKNKVWFTTPGQICDYVENLNLENK